MLSYQSNVQKAKENIHKVSALAYSPNMIKFAIANSDQVITLYDSNFQKKDKIPTRGAKKGNKNYLIKSIAFSPDSTIIAVAQTDNIIYGYRIGADWGEKKSICTKIPANSPVTTMIWPIETLHELYFGTAEGQVRIGYIKNHKSQALYSTGSYVVTLASGRQNKYIVSGHLDGSIFLYNTETKTYKKLITAPTVPYALGFGKNIFFAGNDNTVTVMGQSGNIIQKFDYSSQKELRDFTGACFNPAGDCAVLLNYSQFFVYGFNSKRGEWEEKGNFKISNYYSITAGCWKPDGTKFFTGNLTGSVDAFDISMKKMKFKGKFELSYISSHKIKVLSLEKGTEAVLNSKRNLEIGKIDILKEKLVVGETKETLVLLSLENGKCSEIEWLGSGNEKFETKGDLCWISNAGEVSVIEFGQDEIAGTFRTEYVKPKLISAVVKNQHKYIAFLLDMKTISILNLNSKITEKTVEHDSKITSLAFNSNGSKILFRDKRKSLFLYSLSSDEKQILLNYCQFFQWVPESDVIVAQSKQALEIWYSSDSIDKKSSIPLKGSVIKVKDSSVVVLQQHQQNLIQLDELLIKFGFALENKDLSKCVQILEEKQSSSGHWKTLLRVALEQKNYFIAQRCHSALKDYPKARFFRKLNKKIDQLQKEGMSQQQALSNFEVQAQLALMDRQFQKAEQIYLEKEQVEKAIQMYQELQKWEDSLRIVEKFDNYQELKQKYLDWLLETGQQEKAAELKEKENQFQEAVNLYLEAGLPVRAADLLKNFDQNSEIFEKVMRQLKKREQYSKMGEVYQQFGDNTKAMNYFMKGTEFWKAVELAKNNQPELVVKMHEKWGDYLMDENEKENAINHFVEAGALKKAIEAAIAAQHWKKAISLLENFSESQSQEYCIQIAQKLEQNKQYELAEKYYQKAQQNEKVLEMYLQNQDFQNAFRFAKDKFQQQEYNHIMISHAQKLEKSKNYKSAEEIYINLEAPEKAIKMYKNAENWDQMLRLFQIYRSENLKEAHVLIAKKLEEKDELQRAERHFVESGQWTRAVDMYEKRRLFEDCVRICKNYASDRDTVERAKRWDNLIGEQQLQDILKKMGLVDALVDFLCEKKKFDEAFQLAQKHKEQDVHLSYAMYLEDEQKYIDSENHYLKAGKFDQAVNMYLDIEDHQSALRIARQYDQGLLPAIYLQQAQFYKERGEIEKMEISFANARRPDLAIQSYIEMQRFQEAMRVAQKYRPDLVAEISSKMELGNTECLSVEEILQQAKMWEENRNWNKAIDYYLEITEDKLEDEQRLIQIWLRAIQVSRDFVGDRNFDVVKIVCKRLRDLSRLGLAGECYMDIGYYEEAAKCFLAVNDFEKSKFCIQKVQNNDQLQSLFDQKHREFLKERGEAEKLLGQQDVVEGLNLMAERGDWLQVLSIAQSKSQQIFENYMKKFVQENLQKQKLREILDVFAKFGMLENLSQLNKELCKKVIQQNDVTNIQKLKLILKNENSDTLKDESIVIRLLYLKSLYQKTNLSELLQKLLLSLLRYPELVRHDQALLEAGEYLKKNGQDIHAFMLLNRYIDYFDSIEDKTELEENEEFQKTDFYQQQNISLPETNIVNEDKRTQLRDWLLQITVQNSQGLSLPSKTCKSCHQQIYQNNINCPYCKHNSQICNLTGSPLEQKTSCKNCNINFDKENLQIYQKHFENCPNCDKNLYQIILQ